MADEQPNTTLSPLLESIRRPIPGENGCGKDVSYDDDYLAIKAEIDKLSAVGGKVDQERAAELRQLMDATRGTLRKSDRAEAEKQLEERASVVKSSGGPDYLLIVDRASRILAEKSKDLRVASYLCFGLWQIQVAAGLAEGLAALDLLVGEFWDGLYPPKTRLGARKAAIDFLSSKLPEIVEFASVKESDADHLMRAQHTLGQLQVRLTEKMPNDPPSLLGLKQVVERCLNRIPKPRPAANEETGGAANPQLQGSQAASPLQTPASVGELRTAQDAIDLVKKAAKFLRDQQRNSPVPYRLLRSARWDPLTSLPPNENGRTRLEPPASQRRNFLSGLCTGGEWTRLLEECEVGFGQPGFHLWFDLQRLTVMALDGLGESFRSVRSAMVLELALLLQRLPNIASLTFTDGTPFAAPATADWIAESVIPALGGSAPTPSTPFLGSAAPDDELTARIAESKRILDGGDLAGAVALLQSGPVNSRKAAFQRKLAMAALCLRGNQPAIARPLLEELEEEIRKHSIDEWEPALGLEVWTSLHKCYALLTAGPPSPGKQALQQQAEKVFERICRLDVGFALAAAGARSKPTRPEAPPPKPAEAQPAVPTTAEKLSPAGLDAGAGNGHEVNKGSTAHSPL